jgi:multidrug resistance efflux pump
MAFRATVDAKEVNQAGTWALPVIEGGDVVAVLVARFGSGQVASPPALPLLRASLGLAEPLLRHWREADRSLPRHALDSLRNGWQRLWTPGHLVWKLGVGLTVAALLVLTCIPVTDRVTANTAIEGKVRQVVATPVDGFIAQALVRPGEQVTAGQVLAKLDDRDLKLEQAKQRSERDQAAGKLRQAMAERDSAQVALTSAELRQTEAQLALVEAKLLRSVLVAPMAGLVVTGDWVQHIGGPVEAGKEMFEIASTDGYRVVLHVPDRYIARVRPGQTGQLRLTGQPQVVHEFEVKVVTATASVQEGVNGFRVEAAWKGDPPRLSPGMQGVGKIEVGQSSLLEIWTRSTVDWLRLKLWSWWW